MSCNLTCWSLDGGEVEDDGFVCSFVFDNSVSFPSSLLSPLISWDLLFLMLLFSFLLVSSVKDEDVSSASETIEEVSRIGELNFFPCDLLYLMLLFSFLPVSSVKDEDVSSAASLST